MNRLKITFIPLGVILIATVIGFRTVNSQVKIDTGFLKEGDILFQTSKSGQSQAIQLATHSKYSHCGIIINKGGKNFVLEAVQPVKLTDIEKWIAKGEGRHYVVKRLKKSSEILTSVTLTKLRKSGNRFIGKGYDLYFEWSDDKIYCSELIWKMYYDATGLEVGKLENLKDFDLSSKAVKQKLQERYKNQIPLNEKVISPVSIFNSDLLATVKEI